MLKLIPGERFYSFFVQHYFQQKHVSWTPVFFSDENIRAGINYQAVSKTMNMPPCWEQIKAKALAEQHPLDTPHF